MAGISTTDRGFRGDVMETVRNIHRLALVKQLELFPMDAGDLIEGFDLDGMPARLDYYTDGSRDACDQMLDQLRLMQGALLDNVHDDIADVRMTVHDWQGTAAESFKTYLGEVETATENQIAFAGELAVVIKANRELIRGVREDVALILDNTVTALENLKDDGGSTLGTILQVAGIVLAVIGSVPTGGGSMALFGAVFAGSAMQIAGTIASSQTAGVGGGTPVDVLRSMYRALSQLDGQVFQLRYGLHQGLRDLAEAADLYRDVLHPRLLTGTPDQPKPSINGTYSLDDFRPPP